MTPRRRAAGACAAAFAAILCVAPQGRAAEPAALVETRSFAPIAAGDVSVDYRDNTELNTRLAEVIARALAARGFVPADDGTMRLDFRTAVRRPDDGGLQLRFYGEGGDRTGLEEFRVGVGFPERDSGDRHVRYEVFMDLIDRRTHEIVWTGKATVDLAGSDRFRATSALAEELVRRIGLTSDQ